ncbi:MAG: OmpA family protein [Muribaculaceae bacterium]|nr:OmpA family protein [Muribaculaceae bacterium]
MKKSIITIYVGLTSLLFSAVPALAAPEERNHDLDELTFSEMLASVETGKGGDLIRQFQEKEARSKLSKNYQKNGTNLETCRNKEVLVLTIPADKLFAPNDVELLPGVGEYLNPVKRYLREPDMYRVLLVMHTDNTGSEVYREELTADRVEAVFDWFNNQGADTSYMFAYSMADDMGIVPNTSMENRAKNRRLEIYLMPGSRMVKQASSGRIEF